MRHCSVAVLLLALLLAAWPALAQTKELPDFSRKQLAPGETLDAPDWSQFHPGADKPQAKGPDFYTRCVKDQGDYLNERDREALCACMAAHQAEVDKAQPEYWTGKIATRPASPYETFLARVFAPCMYLEAFQLATDECYADNSYRIMFESDEHFESYCKCYANQAEKYVRQYAEPLIAAKLSSTPAGKIDGTKDPARLVMRDIDYRIFMNDRRKECIAEFGIQTSR